MGNYDIGLDTDITRNFKFRELITVPGSSSTFFDEINNCNKIISNLCVLAGHLQIIRDKLGKPLVCSSRGHSVYRSLEFEINRGRSGKSYHCLGLAADFHVHGFTDIYSTRDIILDITSRHCGIILYHNKTNPVLSWIHFDLRDNEYIDYIEI